MLLKLSLSQFKIDYYYFKILYAINMVITNKISIEYTQKEMRR